MNISFRDSKVLFFYYAMYFNSYHFNESIALKILVTESNVEGKSSVTIVYLFSIFAIVLSKLRLLV